MAAEDIDLKLIIKALLDSKGFEDAQASLKQLAATTTSAKAPVEDLGKKAGGLTKELGGSRGAVADLTRVLLQNIGVTGPAGEVAKAAGAGMTLLGTGVGGAALAATGFVAIAALVVPKLMELWRRSQDLSAETKQVISSLAGLREQLQGLLQDVPSLNEKYGALVKTLQDLALQNEAIEAQNMRKAIEEMTVALGKVGPQQSIWLSLLQLTRPEMLAFAQGMDKDSKAANELRTQIAAAGGALTLHAEAAQKGLTIEQLLAEQRRAGVISAKQEAEAIEKLKKAQEELNQAVRDGTYYVDQSALARDSDALAARDQERALGKLTKEQVDALTKMPDETDSEEERARKAQEIRDQDLAEERAAAAEKRSLMASTAAEAFAGLASLFGKNKALNIAAAIADTYAGANKAFAQGGILGFVMGAAIIAQGLANVQQIRKQEIGFDDPFSDLVAAKMGRKSAQDFARHFGGTFAASLPGAMAGATAGGTTYNQTTINRGVTLQGGVHLGGFFGTSKRQLMRSINRELIKTQRFEDRTRLR